MADKAVSELVAAQQITATDLFVLEQNGTAKKLTGQVLLNWLTAAADGHGGIASIEKQSTSGLADTYRITLADTTTFDFVVTNGRGIVSVEKTGTDGLVDTYTITFNDGSESAFTVTNGAKGDKGDNTYTWIKYAAQEPTETSHSIGNLPDDWIGIYYGPLDAAPDDWKQYNWFKMKGEQGDTGAPATLVSSSVTYQVGDSGSIIPSGIWSDTVAVVPQGKYLWTRTVTQFNTGGPITAYSVSRMGIDGTGSVSSVSGVSPDPDGNVPLKAENINALPTAGGSMTGPINMNGQALKGLNAPTADDQAVNWGSVKNAYGIGENVLVPVKDGGTGAGDPKTARENLEVAQAIESPDHPGCYYRMVDGEQEWLNPPMLGGVEYRTVERYGNKPVYRKQVVYTLNTSGTKDILIDHGITNFGSCIFAFGRAGQYLFPSLEGADTLTGILTVGSSGITMRFVASTFSGQSQFLLWYIKA